MLTSEELKAATTKMSKDQQLRNLIGSLASIKCHTTVITCTPEDRWEAQQFSLIEKWSKYSYQLTKIFPKVNIQIKNKKDNKKIIKLDPSCSAPGV